MTKKQLWATVLIISLISIADYQFFAEGNFARSISPAARSIAHLLALLLIGWAGCRALSKNVNPIYSRLWPGGYTAVLIIAVIVGVGYYRYHLFAAQLAPIGTLRSFFITPAPFLLLYILQKIVPVVEDDNNN